MEKPLEQTCDEVHQDFAVAQMWAAGKHSYPPCDLPAALRDLLCFKMLSVRVSVDTSSPKLRSVLSHPAVRAALSTLLLGEIPGPQLVLPPRTCSGPAELCDEAILLLMVMATLSDEGRAAARAIISGVPDQERPSKRSKTCSTDAQDTTLVKQCREWLAAPSGDGKPAPTDGYGALTLLLSGPQLTMKITISCESGTIAALLRSADARGAVLDGLFGVDRLQTGVEVEWPATGALVRRLYGPHDNDRGGAMLASGLMHEYPDALVGVQFNSNLVREILASRGSRWLSVRKDYVRRCLSSQSDELWKHVKAIDDLLSAEDAAEDTVDAVAVDAVARRITDHKTNVLRILATVTDVEKHCAPGDVMTADQLDTRENLIARIRDGDYLLYQNDPGDIADQVMGALLKWQEHGNYGMWHFWTENDIKELIKNYDVLKAQQKPGDSPAAILVYLVKTLLAMFDAAYPWLWREEDRHSRDMTIAWLDDVAAIIVRIRKRMDFDDELDGGSSLATDLEKLDTFRCCFAPKFRDEK